ncbi:hypothetical protein AB0L63_24250 [Nocardia sp. NPDC051990]|uniref:hypothetical protein n=1 Tax=Nocardia sp. NPDC051990 TaxID=3155285 RepID=UPI003429C600
MKPTVMRGKSSTPPGWRRIGYSAGDFVVLAIDFELTSRVEAGFRDLIALFPEPLTVWQAVQPPAGSPTGDYISWWSNRLDTANADIVAVMGYCAGSIFASAMADEIERLRGRRPRTVVFNPGRPSRDSVDRDFRAVIGSLSPLSIAERAEVIDQAEAILTDWDRDVGAALDRLLALYCAQAGIAFDRAGVAADVGQQLVDVFRSYTAYLRAAHLITPRSSWSAATAVCSVEGDGEPGFAERTIPIMERRQDLLRSATAAQTVFELLSEVSEW